MIDSRCTFPSSGPVATTQRRSTLNRSFHVRSALTEFEIQDKQNLPELSAQGIHLLHRATGAEVVLLRDRNPIMGFCLAFDTPALDDTGWTHIAEHVRSRQCKSFPGVPEVLQATALGSHYVDLNAMTSPDETTYFLSGARPDEFYRLANIMTKVVLQSKCSEQDFQIEGWRLEASPKGKLGVVTSSKF